VIADSILAAIERARDKEKTPTSQDALVSMLCAAMYEVAGSDVIARSILAAIKDALVSICQFYLAHNQEEEEGAHDASGEDNAAS
jgi:hypothetical protein